MLHRATVLVVQEFFFSVPKVEVFFVLFYQPLKYELTFQVCGAIFSMNNMERKIIEQEERYKNNCHLLKY